MAPIPSRWHDGTVSLQPYDTPAKLIALSFALYATRQQMAGHVPGEVEATVTIKCRDGQTVGHLDLDVDDIERVKKAMSRLTDEDFGPFERKELDQLLAEYRAQ